MYQFKVALLLILCFNRVALCFNFVSAVHVVHCGTILLVEDDETLRRTLTRILECEGFTVYEAALGKRLLEILRQHPVDLILLDMRLPDTTGLEMIQAVRQQTDIPIIVISGEKNKAKTVSGLYLGADDHIMKPFDIDELIARITANLRRYRGEFPVCARPGQHQGAETRVTFVGWTLDREKLQIFNEANVSGDLTAHEFRLLELLVSNAGRVFKRKELCEAIRVQNYVPTPRAIDLKIMRIRKKIGDDAANPRLIKTVRGVGYTMDKNIVSDESISHLPTP